MVSLQAPSRWCPSLNTCVVQTPEVCANRWKFHQNTWPETDVARTNTAGTQQKFRS
jgi:hypothetical protein